MMGVVQPTSNLLMFTSERKAWGNKRILYVFSGDKYSSTKTNNSCIRTFVSGPQVQCLITVK